MPRDQARGTTGALAAATDMSEEFYVSPNYRGDQVDPTKLDDRIKVYEDRLLGWFLEPARALLSVPNSAFAVLTILLGYFESYWIYWTGQDSRYHEGEFFRCGFRAVMRDGAAVEPEGSLSVEDALGLVAETMYESARCGLYHQWMTRHPIQMTDSITNVMRVEGTESGDIYRVLINAGRFFNVVEGHFQQYVAQLRDQSQVDVRERFNNGWDELTRGGRRSPSDRAGGSARPPRKSPRSRASDQQRSRQEGE